MPWLRLLVPALLAVLVLPGLVFAASDHESLHLSTWSVLPFVLLLLTIAILPLFAERWWHSNANKAIICAALALPVLCYLAYLDWVEHQPALAVLGHQMFEYVSFLTLLASLFIVSGGVVLTGDLRATPRVNTTFLTIGVCLASVIGTTGASMLLIRPLLRTNRQRERTGHIPIFFIFTVSNLGGLLTPLGDPPLFLGFLRGVPFEWTLSLWPQWLIANGTLLIVFYLWDSLAYAGERAKALAEDNTQVEPLALRGVFNFLLLGGIIVAVLLQSWIPGTQGHVLGIVLMVTLAGLSWVLTPRRDREANEFTWAPILEVAVLFAGIFVVMVPALELLKTHGKEFGVTQPWQYYYLTGVLSSFLDNAPTYMALATLAASPDELKTLVTNAPTLLAAISCGAVFFGAMTYIGNGPNFMVKAIADAAGYRTPSFFGYMVYSCLVLLPILVVIALLFFRG